MLFHNVFRVFFITTLLLILIESSWSCTALVAGKLATEDGSILVTHSDDGEGRNDPRIMLVPSRTVKDENATRPILPDTEDYPRYVGYDRGPDYHPSSEYTPLTVPIGYIPEVQKTYAYFDGNYGIVNTVGLVAGGESTCSGVFAAKSVGNGGEALFSINELSRIALERCIDARCAISLMGSLAEKHGFYGADASFEGSAESLIVADTEEAFVFHILPDDTGRSAVWVAQRVPDDAATVVANMFTIRHVNLNDTFNFMGSDYMYVVAERNGLWKSSDDGLLDFTLVFSDGEYAHKYYSGRRMWGAFRRLAPSLNLEPDYVDDLRLVAAYPWSVVPERKVTLQDFFEIHRDRYEGTKYDPALSLAAGPFGDPDRFTAGPGEAAFAASAPDGQPGSWERTIALFRTTYTTVVQTSASSPATMWLGLHAAHGTCFLPFDVRIDSLPSSITRGSMTTLDRSSAFWAFRYIHVLSRLRYDKLSKIISNASQLWEGRGMRVQNMGNAIAAGSAEVLTNLYHDHAASVLDFWWKLADQMVFSYADGFNNVADPPGKAMGYPMHWLEAVGYGDGPPPPHSYGLNPPKSSKKDETDAGIWKYRLWKNNVIAQHL